MDEQFEKYWYDEEPPFMPLPFPNDHKELKEWCRQSFVAGRAAGIEWAEIATAELCYEIAKSDKQTRAITITKAQQDDHNRCCDFIASKIKERFCLEI